MFVPALPGLEHILVDAHGRQHVVLRAQETSLQFLVEGADVTAGPVRFALVMRGLTATHEACGHLSALRRILSRASADRKDWTAPLLRLRNALVALDGHAAGASYREIGVVLYGPDYVALDWRLAPKERVRRHVRRGLALSQGGYRNFLK